MSALRVAVLGLGEAGGRIASDLVALGVVVSGWDPDASRQAEGVRSAASAAAAAERADVVLSANSASAAVTAARDAIEVVGDEPGDAAERKLLRSVFVKGVAAAAVESLAAAEAAGCEEWLRDDIASVLATADSSFLDRLVDGSRRHAGRRIVEMEAACERLRELGVAPRVASSAAAWLADLQREVRV
jgi:3-hydroxyisobutyrate dehydrogenase-like beta-hydroxyacid dehydrogenase